MKNKIIKSIPIINNNTCNTLEISIYYSKGGMNYFTGKDESRGIYISVSPYNIESYNNNLITKSFTAFSGVKKLLKEIKRFNQKEFDNFVVDNNIIDDLINYTVNKNNLQIEI